MKINKKYLEKRLSDSHYIELQLGLVSQDDFNFLLSRDVASFIYLAVKGAEALSIIVEDPE